MSLLPRIRTEVPMLTHSPAQRLPSLLRELARSLPYRRARLRGSRSTITIFHFCGNSPTKCSTAQTSRRNENAEPFSGAHSHLASRERMLREVQRSSCLPTSVLGGCGSHRSLILTEHMKNESLYRIVVVVLLAAVLVVQLLIFYRMQTGSPTLADLRKAKPEQRPEMLLRIPLVRVEGTVDVAGTVDVDVNNTPLEVQIVR